MEELPVEDGPQKFPEPASIIELSSSDSDSDTENFEDSTHVAYGKRSRASNGVDGGFFKKQKFDGLGVVLPLGFLDPLPPKEEALPLPEPILHSQPSVLVRRCKQFWKAGDFEDYPGGDAVSSVGNSSGMDHVRVHPKFLHSNATSHRWALGAFAKLLDNSLDELCHGATYVNIDVLQNKKDGSRMLLVEDNGGGMDPDKMRQCMSLGYSAKSKLTNTIGRYGNGFKTSTMRLGADVIVFSRCCGKDGKSPTQSIGMLSYTFLRCTRKEDVVVPMFNLMKGQGTCIIIYNLWEDDQGELELDFDTDQHDIQIKGVNRDEKKIQMAKQFPNSRHFLTYQHSLRCYASILYLRLPRGFRSILRGKDVEHHNIVNDMMLIKEVTYRPQPGADGIPKGPNMVAVVKIGFVKDAKKHIDVQGFNVYQKNRLIKPFWRIWNSTGSDGRGVIGVLEANFVEPAHDKQGFERTIVLSRLEARLVLMQKNYWYTYCQEIGYAPRRPQKLVNESAVRETSLEYHHHHSSSQHIKKSTCLSGGTPLPDPNKVCLRQKLIRISETEKSLKIMDPKYGNGHMYGKRENGTKSATKYGEPTSVPPEHVIHGSSHKAFPTHKSFLKDDSCTTQSLSTYSRNFEVQQDHSSNGQSNQVATQMQSKSISTYSKNREVQQDHSSILQINRIATDSSNGQINRIATHLPSKAADVACNGHGYAPSNSNADGLGHLKEDNCELKDRLKKMEDSALRNLQFERDRCKSQEAQLNEAEQKIEEMNKEQEALIDIFSEERSKRDNDEEKLRKKLEDASNTIQEVLDKVRLLDNTSYPNCKPGRKCV